MLDSVKVGVEVDVAGGLPATVIVGLPDTAVQESKERVRAALRNAGHTFPMRRVVVNLTPADLRKEGPSFDLPIGIGILAASEQVDPQLLGDFLFLGEVSLDGALRPVTGVLPIAAAAKKLGFNWARGSLSQCQRSCSSGKGFGSMGLNICPKSLPF